MFSFWLLKCSDTSILCNMITLIYIEVLECNCLVSFIIFELPGIVGKEPISTEWIDEKKILYLKSNEISFLDQVYGSMDSKASFTHDIIQAEYISCS